MQTLVTGATGLIGNALAKQLVERGHAVRAFVRDVARAQRLLPPAVECVRGDIEDPNSLLAAMNGVEWVFHVAGMPEQWQPDERVFERVNTQGTANVMQAALTAKIKRVVYTSTMDVFAAEPGGTLVETRLDTNPKATAYERSKQAAEREVEAVRARGLDVVYMNPGAVYGPSPVHVGVNSLFIQFLRGKMPLVPPGGMALVYVDGVAAAHIAAAERGRDGERYLLGDEHADNAELVALIAREAGVKKVPAVAPVWLMKVLAQVSAPLARTFGFKPLVAPGQLSFLLWNPRIDSSKAIRELGFTPLLLQEGVRRTVAFLREQRLVPAK
jgi:dihydroflavonol-4-reductase